MIIVSSNLKAKEDTLSSVLPDIRVTADRILSEKSLKYNAYNLITTDEIKQKNPWQMNEVLNNVPGIFINDYGGLGGLKTISMRGSTSNQSLIMIDGIKINSSQSGISDLSLVPISFIDEIEVARGGFSAVFGGNAIGGIVNLIASDYEKNKFNLAINAGSFGEYFISGFSEFGSDKINQKISAEFKTSEGDYPFISNESHKKNNRASSDFIMYSASSFTRMNVSNWQLSNWVILQKSGRNIPGQFIENAIKDDNLPILKEDRAIFLLKANNQINKNSTLSLSVNSKIDNYLYLDKEYYGEGFPEFKAEFVNKDFVLNLKFNSDIGMFDYNISAETGYSLLTGNQLEFATNEKVERYLLAVSGKAESDIKVSSIGEIDYSLGLRFDNFSDVGKSLSSFLGILFKPEVPGFQAKFQISSNFRPPSFNEMYYLNYGNSDLRPEKSISLNLGLMNNTFDKINFQLDGFYMITNDRIVSVPKSQISWSAENISKVITKGFEISANIYLFKKYLYFNLAYTYQDARNSAEDDNNYGKLIVYMPQEIISGSVVFQYGNFTLGTTLRYSGYYFSLPDNSYESIIDGYSLLDSYLNYSWILGKVDINFRFDCRNIFDEQYEIIKNYPMPGRSFRIGMAIIY
jgi:outer membrane cobalamin receptor